MQFSWLKVTLVRVGGLFHSPDPVVPVGDGPPGQQEEPEKESRRELVFRIIQALSTLLVLIITSANYVSTKDEDELKRSWWTYVLILSGSTVPFLIYVVFLERRLLERTRHGKRFLLLLRVAAEATAAFFWLDGFAGLIIMSMNLSSETKNSHDGVSNANAFATFCGFVNFFSFATLAYLYWKLLRGLPLAVARHDQTPPVLDVEAPEERKGAVAIMAVRVEAGSGEIRP